jgi:hypothetical protein
MRIAIVKSDKDMVLKGYKRKTEDAEDRATEVFA